MDPNAGQDSGTGLKVLIKKVLQNKPAWCLCFDVVNGSVTEYMEHKHVEVKGNEREG